MVNLKPLDKIVIETEKRPGKEPVVIWVSEGLRKYELKREYVHAARLAAEEKALDDYASPPEIDRDYFNEAKEFIRELPGFIAGLGRFLYYLTNTDKPKEWAKIINHAASQAM